MEEAPTRALVSTILQHAEDFPWKMQDIGLLGLRLDERREYRLHVWDPTYSAVDDDPPIHDHPYDFTSTVIAGTMTTTRYELSSAGGGFTRYRFVPSDEGNRIADTVRLSGTSVTYAAGGSYRQLAHELHDSRQEPGTVTVLHCNFREVAELTVCRKGSAWVSGRSRPASSDAIKRITSKALQSF